jgi:multidrug efflux pump
VKNFNLSEWALEHRSLVDWCVNYRKTVIFITVAVFALSIFGFRFVQNQFFPSSNRPELIVDL